MTDTIIAQSTPPGQSALALIRISGPMCKDIAKKALSIPSPTPRFSYLRNYISLDPELGMIDQVVAVFFQAKKSFTGDDTLELSCHGNPLIVEKIIQDLSKRGCRIADPGEFSKRAFLTGKIDLNQAESIIEVISAKSEAELLIANANLLGASSKTFKSLQERILQYQAELEASIDFPEEELEFESNERLLKSLSLLIDEMKSLIKNSEKKTELSESLKVLIIGPPNAGKSTLFNSLVGQDRALVSENPGTTRDYLTYQIKIGKYRIELIDTAGIRTTEDETESLGIQKSFELLGNSHLILFVIDGSTPYPTEFYDLIAPSISTKNIVIIENKKDLSIPDYKSKYPEHYSTLSICANSPKDTEVVLDEIDQYFRGEFPTDPSNELLINARHANLLQSALKELSSSREGMKNQIGTEFILQKINSCRDFIDQIIGDKSNEDVLDKIFNQFCIGK